MTETKPAQRGGGAAEDALGELVRAAGRRPEPPAAHYRAVREAARVAWRANVRLRRRRRWLALAAAVVVAVGLGIVIGSRDESERAPVATLARAEGALSSFARSAQAWQPLADDAALYAGDRLRTGSTGGAAFALAAGGSLRVAAGTEIRMAGERRLELVTGTVYVDSNGARGADRVEVATPLGRVRDIGTQFEVHRGASALRVRVRSGRIELVGSAFGENVEAPAGEELELARSGELERRAIAPDAPGWDWAAGLAVPPPEGGTVLGYLEWVARETGKALRFESASTELRAEFVRWRGDVRGLTPLQVLDAIVATSDFRYELTPDGGILIGQG